jgi:Tfp pilus assembly protein PilN
MIKINLLPKSINERRIVKNTAILFGVIVITVIAIGILYTQVFLVKQVQDMQAKADAAEQLRREVEQIEGETATIKKNTEPINTKIKFITDVLAYNQEYPKLYEDIAKWTYEKIAYTSLVCNGAVVTMTARARSLDDLGRYLLNMYQARELFSQVAISGVPGYPVESSSSGAQVQDIGMSPWGGGGPQGSFEGISAITAGVQQGPHAQYINFTVTCTLRTPIVAPTFGNVGAPGAPGMPGAPPTPGMQPPPMGGPEAPPDVMPPGGGAQPPPP